MQAVELPKRYAVSADIFYISFMSLAVKDFLVYVIELCAERFFGGNKTMAYNQLKNTDQLSFYKDTYDTSHTLSSEYLLEEIKERFTEYGIIL